MSQSAKKSYDKQELPVAKIAGIIVSGIILLTAFFLISREYFISTTEEIVYEQVLKPESLKLQQLRVRETELLNSYKFIDQNKGVVQIPIERAMDLLAEEYFRSNAQKSGK